MSELERIQEAETKILKTVTYQVLRYNPENGGGPRLQEYSVPVTKGMTVLDGLTWIKEHLDSTLVWRSSCRMERGSSGWNAQRPATRDRARF